MSRTFQIHSNTGMLFRYLDNYSFMDKCSFGLLCCYFDESYVYINIKYVIIKLLNLLNT